MSPSPFVPLQLCLVGGEGRRRDSGDVEVRTDETVTKSADVLAGVYVSDRSHEKAWDSGISCGLDGFITTPSCCRSTEVECWFRIHPDPSYVRGWDGRPLPSSFSTVFGVLVGLTVTSGGTLRLRFRCLRSFFRPLCAISCLLPSSLRSTSPLRSSVGLGRVGPWDGRPSPLDPSCVVRLRSRPRRTGFVTGDTGCKMDDPAANPPRAALR